MLSRRKSSNPQVQNRAMIPKLLLLRLLSSFSSLAAPVELLVVASLLNRNIKSRLLVRDPEKAIDLFGKQDEETLQVFKGDTRNPEALDPSIFEGVTHVICCTGTTAFPSKRWDGDNTPERVDWDGVRNLVLALPPSLKRIVLVSSVGVTKFNELPWSIMNLFGVLKFKKMGEDFLRNSGLPFTIIRPGRLTDGPYTSYDLNTLLKATAGQRRAVLIGQGDKLVGEASRLVIAEACIQALDIESTQGNVYEINSVEGEGPGSDPQKWQELFKAAQGQ
ncbi:sanguinarine reductase isoform X2 [Corylus avellana]|uniref:sanguinarine reductase isoform X2 n=1 Tax=Corylus avellana TaxID=13451 RepID=UPI00286C0157|nr:sanguinarine reductase isoform X2 [Corylus avellana]